MKKTFLNLWPLLFLATLVNCAHSEPKTVPVAEKPKQNVSIEAKQAAAQLGSAHVTEVTFPKKTAALSKKNFDKIDLALKEAQKKDTIDHILVVAWGDAEPDHKKELANARAETVKAWIEAKNSDFKVETLNMAEQVNGLKEFLKTEDARVQKAFEAEDAPTSPKEGKAVVIISVRT